MFKTNSLKSTYQSVDPKTKLEKTRKCYEIFFYKYLHHVSILLFFKNTRKLIFLNICVIQD